VGKQTRWLKSFWNEYLDDRAQSGDTSRPELKRSQQYLNAEERRKQLREQIKNKFDFDSSDVSGLSTETLDRIAAVDSNQEAHRIRVASGSGISRADPKPYTTRLAHRIRSLRISLYTTGKARRHLHGDRLLASVRKLASLRLSLVPERL